jgi:hypothetical protein
MMAPESAMNPSLTPRNSRIAIAKTVSRNMPTVMVANSLSGMSDFTLAMASADGLPIRRKP